MYIGLLQKFCLYELMSSQAPFAMTSPLRIWPMLWCHIGGFRMSHFFQNRSYETRLTITFTIFVRSIQFHSIRKLNHKNNTLVQIGCKMHAILFIVTVQNLKKIYLFSLCSLWLILTRSPKISDQNKSEAREPEGLVKITYGIVASSLFKRAGNSN